MTDMIIVGSRFKLTAFQEAATGDYRTDDAAPIGQRRSLIQFNTAIAWPC